MTEPTDDFKPGEPIFSFTIDAEGVVDSRLLGGHPRMVAHMLRHVADSLDEVGDELGLEELETECGHVKEEIRADSPEELDEFRAEFDAKRRAAKLS